MVDIVSNIPSSFIKYYKLYKYRKTNISLHAELNHASYPIAIKYVSILQNK